jgi:hypothetical protein
MDDLGEPPPPPRLERQNAVDLLRINGQDYPVSYENGTQTITLNGVVKQVFTDSNGRYIMINEANVHEGGWRPKTRRPRRTRKSRKSRR